MKPAPGAWTWSAFLIIIIDLYYRPMTGDGVAACVRAGARACVRDRVHGYARLQHIIDQHTLPYIIDYSHSHRLASAEPAAFRCLWYRL